MGMTYHGILYLINGIMINVSKALFGGPAIMDSTADPYIYMDISDDVFNCFSRQQSWSTQSI